MSLTAGIQTLDDLDLENQLVFVRADLDSPLTKGGELIDDGRIAGTAETVKKLQELGARVVVASRFGEAGRGEKKRKNSNAPPSIEPAAALLGQLCECDVLLPDGCTGESVKKVLMDLRVTQICVLENLANEDELGQPAEAFARQLESTFDAYVADSVRVLESQSATTTLLPRLMEFKAASPRVMRELSAIDRINRGIDAPRVVVWGGNTLSGRLDLLHKLAKDDAQVLLAGVAANTVVRALGGAVGRSAIEEEYLAGARTLAEKLGNRLILPLDFVAAASPNAERGEVRDARHIPENEMALDIGPATQARYTELVARARTSIWCGTIGFHKAEAFAGGTRAIYRAFDRTSGFTMVAGEDSVAAARAIDPDRTGIIDCIAQGGTATLALLTDTKLAGLAALRGTK